MRVVLLLSLIASALPIAAQTPTTVADLLKPSKSAYIEPIWSPDGKSFVYENEGAVYRARMATDKPHRWFDLNALKSATAPDALPHPFDWRNRRVSTDDLQWFPDGKSILAVRDGALYIVHENGKPARIPLDELTEDPQLSPDGKLVLYRVGSDLKVLNLASHRETPITSDGSATLLNGRLDWVYPEELDLGQAAWWSPDASRIAFLQFDISQEFIYPQADLLGERAVREPERYPQAGTPNARVRLGIVAATGGPVVWVGVGNSSDVLLPRVSWLPDSSAVALQSMPRTQNALQLYFCDPGTGSARPILKEESTTWVNLGDNPRFLKNRHEFLWTSERSGFRHIYRYSNEGKLLGQLTSGAWEVKAITAVDEANSTVYYTASQDSPLQTQLYRVPFEGGEPKRITELGFDHRIGSNLDGHAFVDEFSNLQTPPETVLRNQDGNALATLQPSNPKTLKYEGQSPEIVSFKAGDGTILYGRLLKPLNFDPQRKYPLIVRVYGGPGAQGVRNEWTRPDMDAVYASQGYLVWQLDNHGSTGRGHAFEEPIFHHLGTVEVRDQRAGVQYLTAQGFVDRDRIGITGWSYGGYMTIRCLLQAADLFKVGVAGAPVTDWRNYDTIYTERYMGLPSANPAAYDNSSNLPSASNLVGHLFIQHNLEDDNVLFQNTMQMANALERANKQYSLQLYPCKSHGVDIELRQPLDDGMLDFFNRNLR